MEKNKGSISIAMALSGAASGLLILGGAFAWTYTQLTGVQAHASQTDVKVATIEQKTNDVDSRLDRIENKLDMLISIKK